MIQDYAVGININFFFYKKYAYKLGKKPGNLQKL